MLTFCVTLIFCDTETYIMGGLTIPIGRASLEGTHIRTLEAGTWDDILLGDFMESYAGVRREQKKLFVKSLIMGNPRIDLGQTDQKKPEGGIVYGIDILDGTGTGLRPKGKRVFQALRRAVRDWQGRQESDLGA
jgi:hypothetical protein